MIIEGLIILIVIFLVYASCSIRSNIYLKVFCKKQTEEKIVAITFDDGPDPIQTLKVLQVLKEQQIPACFFCIGHKVKGNESLIRQIIDDGHLIGNHSFTHTNHFPLYSLSRMKKDLQACQSALEQVTSQKIKLFRPPFGVTNPTIAKAVRILGYTPIGWNIRTFDTQHPSKEKVLQRIQNKLRPGSIILLHDRMPDSDLLLKEILNLIKEQGYTVVRLDKML
ncbi:polysaccharide deacetylase family protein [uncultured Bacteroides sp.]|uniref:polysaccharide deacetylase family protein n=1 Tax=uncultured Bacteroides sp. TaxID=162156 RepID=UPI0025FC52AA|nr:polysaccharide deacetylase family protein [uncultured Bacteroides sp.]